MKVLYSELKEFLPKLKASPKEVAEAFTFTGLMVDGFKDVRVKGVKDYLISLEVRQNRPDCLGVIGLAREISAYFKTPLTLPKVKKTVSVSPLPAEVRVGSLVKRATAVQIDGLDNSKQTPKWLVEVLEMHDIKSVSLLVDLSNYAMLMTGYPNHLFDSSKVVGKLVWQKNLKDEVFTTLDGSVLQFKAKDELVISDNLGPLVLAGAIGGRRAAISARTTSVIAEVAVYDPKKVRDDARKHKISTEASNRLEKQLAVEHSGWALEFLAGILVNHAGGEVGSKVYDFYPKAESGKNVKEISWKVALAEKVSGIFISKKEASDILTRLGFKVTEKADFLKVMAPAWRSDVEVPADITEEVVRLKGYQHILPVPPKLSPVKEVTSPVTILKDKLRVFATALGFDEALSLPMTTSDANSSFTNLENFPEVKTQNAVNEDLPVLRTSLLGGLLSQQLAFLKKGVYLVQLFEIGKVFWRSGKKFVETEQVSFLLQAEQNQDAVNNLKAKLDSFLRLAGVRALYFEETADPQKIFIHTAVWDVFAGQVKIGQLGLLRERQLSGNKHVSPTAVATFDLDSLLQVVEKDAPKGASELLDKMAVLDANVVCSGLSELNAKLREVRKKHAKHIWSLEVIDSYTSSDRVSKYTLRTTYSGLTETQAKNLHKQLFG